MKYFQQYIYKLLHKILGKELDEKLKIFFISGAYKSVIMQASIAILTFLSSLFIARVTGDKGFGVYTTVFTWVAILSIVATFGLDDLVLKKIPVYVQMKQKKLTKGLVIWVNIIGILTGFLVVFVALWCINGLPILGLQGYFRYFVWALWVIPLFVLVHINQAILRGLHLFFLGQLAEKFVQPLFFFAALFTFYVASEFHLSDIQAIIARTISFVIAALLAVLLMLKYSKPYTNVSETIIEKGPWVSSCRYFAIMSILYVINTRIDIIFLVFFKTGDASIAHYNAALKLSDLALIPFAVLYTVTAPMYAQLYAENKLNKLQSFFTKTTRVAFIIITVILLFLSLGGEWFLQLFGENFVKGYKVLLIMCLAKWVHVFFGPVNYLSMMIDLEKEAAMALITSVVITIFAHLLLIPLLGIEGAALGSLLGLLSFELIISWIVYKNTGIVPSIIGGFSRQTNKLP